jgi:hypothetical protein
VLEWLESTQFSFWMRTEIWGWPLALTIHAFGTALVVGFALIIALRLLGLFETMPYAALNRLIPVIWTGLALQILSGFTLWMTKATRYVADGAFMLKVLLVVVGIILTLYFQGTMKREAAAWESAGAVSSRGVKFVALTLAVWCFVLVMGRMTAYLGSI